MEAWDVLQCSKLIAECALHQVAQYCYVGSRIYYQKCVANWCSLLTVTLDFIWCSRAASDNDICLVTQVSTVFNITQVRSGLTHMPRFYNCKCMLTWPFTILLDCKSHLWMANVGFMHLLWTWYFNDTCFQLYDPTWVLQVRLGEKG